MTTWRSLESFGDFGDMPMNYRESWLLRQVCDPPGDRGFEREDEEKRKRREAERDRKDRQLRKAGRQCPHGCGFYLNTRRYKQALSTHERACLGMTG